MSPAALHLDENERLTALKALDILDTPPETMIVPDALDDPRFADNPLVTNEPHIRFYARQPLNSPSWLRVGTLCMIDRHPRQLSADEQLTLQDLAAWVEREFGSVGLAEVLKQSQEAHACLTRLNQVREEFVHIVSHKFRTALIGIQGFEPGGPLHDISKSIWLRFI